MGVREHGDDCGIIGFTLYSQNDHARPVLSSFFPAGLMLTVPEIGMEITRPGSGLGIGMRLGYLASFEKRVGGNW
jgi:hypothetical protein